jgi:hypothetical protein
LTPRGGANIGRATAILGLGVIALAGLGSPPAFAQVEVTGQWDRLPYTMPINPIHVGLLLTGKILIVAGSENDPSQHDEVSRAALWDMSTGTFAAYDLAWDVFCNGMAFLPDGRALVVGGTAAYDEFTGEARATVFDPFTERFVQVQSTAHGRWYATATAMGDGRILTFAGLNEWGDTNQATEMYRIASGWSPEAQAPWTPPIYPWLHLLPDGRVFVGGADPDSHIFDPASSAWTLDVARTNYGGSRLYGTSVLLPLAPANGYRPRVMVMGGDDPATETAEIIDLSEPAPWWRPVASMSYSRVQLNATLLPDGRVLASGGSALNEDASTAALAAELFDPVTETWSPAGEAAIPRLYHSVALLLPDATVMTAGSNPERGWYDQSIEIWKPPYLFTSGGGLAPRPVIAAAPAAIGYGGAFPVQTPDAGQIGSVVLMRPGSPTHSFDMEQRMVGLSFTRSGTTLTVAGPPTPNIAPPGYYMLFILNTNGVPSVARFVQVSPTPTNTPPHGVITQPATDVTVQTGQPVTFAAAASDPGGAVTTFSWIFPDGAPDAIIAPTGGPVTVTFPSPGTHVVSLTVVDNLGTNDPSPDTRTVTVVQTPAELALAAAVLPTSRSVMVGGTATAFATIIASGDGTATGCRIAPLIWVPAVFHYQTTDPVTNQVTGIPDTPVDIPGGGQQTFVVSFTATAAFPPTDVPLTFACTNTAPAPFVSGVTTLLLSSSVTGVPDIVAAVTTPSGDGIVTIPGPTGTGIFAVATANMGASGSMTVTVDTGGVPLHVALFVCETEPSTGACRAPPQPSVATQINAGATPTFAFFVAGSGPVRFSPAANRVFVRFRDTSGAVRGSTSVAIQTQ